MVGTISEVYLDLRNELRRHGVTSASLEAKELLAFALEIPRDQMNERSGSYLFDQQLTRLDQPPPLWGAFGLYHWGVGFLFDYIPAQS